MLDRIIRITAVVFLFFLLVNFLPAKTTDSVANVSSGTVKTIYVAHSLFSPEPVLASADYICDGTNDSVEIQQAVDALPTQGGKITIYAGEYHLTTTISRAIDNVCIEGVGKGTSLVYNGINPVINAGVRNGWIFKDIKVDAGGIDVSLATEWSMSNVWLNATYVAQRADFSPANNKDSATKKYVDDKVISDSNLSSAAQDAISKRHSQNTDTALGIQLANLNMGTFAITNVGNVDGYDVSALGSASHSQNTDSTLTTNGSTVLISGGTLKSNLAVDSSVTVDGVDISSLSSSSHSQQHSITSTSDHTSTATDGQMLKANSNGLPMNATNTDAQVSSAVTASHSQNTDTSLGIQAADLNMGTKNITNVGNVDGKDVSGLATSAEAVTAAKSDSDISDAISKKHSQNTDTSLGIQLSDLNMGGKNVTNVNLVDGVDVSALSAASGNVTALGMTTGYIPVATSTTGITNSIMTATGVLVSIPKVTGAELCPTISAANWTGGAGWTVGTGTLTRVASAVTTAYPTSAIVPDITKNYVVTFTISSWTAGSVTMTLGDVVSTPLQGNQDVYLYVSPYTTGNLIFTPSATFAGVISAPSVKEYTGGELQVDGGVLYYDSRGHPNRLSHVTRHLSEMQTDTLLDKSRSTLTCSGGVLTYTLYAVYGEGTWNFDGIVYPLHVASASVALTGGTDAVPKTNWVYFELAGNTPTLTASTTGEPTTNHIMVAEFIVGAVSGSSYTIYGYNRARTEVDSFVKRVIGRFENSGSLYVEGALPTVTSTTLSIASGGKWYQGIFEMTSANTVAATGFYFINGDGTYSYSTNLADLHHYGDASMTAMGSNERQNIVWGIVPTTTTASGTLPTTVKLFAVLQSKPSTVYVSNTTAEQDTYEATNYYPSDPQLKEVFIPIARTIIRPSTPVFEVFGSGGYYRDLRGKVTSGGGAVTTDPTIKYTVQAQAAAQTTTTDSQTLYWGSQQVAPSTTAARWRIYIPKSGIIKTVYIYSYAGTAGSNENWSMYVRVNDTSDTLIQTLGANTSDRTWSNSALSIAVTAGDYIEIKEVQPAWGTNPADVTRTGVIYIE